MTIKATPSPGTRILSIIGDNPADAITLKPRCRQTDGTLRKVLLRRSQAGRVLPMRDGLPKLKDFPAELGGSGGTIPE